jgi:signal transduction histidine kinase
VCENALIGYINEMNIPVTSTGTQTDEVRIDGVTRSNMFGQDQAIYHHETSGFLQIQIVDTGIGLEEERLPNIFNEFN